MRFDPAAVEIVDFPETRVALLAHRGDPRTIGDSIRRLIAFRRREGLPPATSTTFNILHSDPQAVAPEDYRLDLACAIRRPVPDNPEGISEGLIHAGRCARLRQTGASDDLRPAMAFLYGEWLPASGEEARDMAPFAQRVRFFPDVPEREAVTDLFLPLR